MLQAMLGAASRILAVPALIPSATVRQLAASLQSVLLTATEPTAGRQVHLGIEAAIFQAGTTWATDHTGACVSGVGHRVVPSPDGSIAMARL